MLIFVFLFSLGLWGIIIGLILLDPLIVATSVVFCLASLLAMVEVCRRVNTAPYVNRYYKIGPLGIAIGTGPDGWPWAFIVKLNGKVIIELIKRGKD